MIGGTAAVADFDYLELGDSNTAFAVGQTALVSAIVGNGLARAQDATPTEAAAVLSIDYTWTATGSETLKEVGLFNAAAAGTMLARTVLAASVSMVEDSTYKYTYTITVS